MLTTPDRGSLDVLEAIAEAIGIAVCATGSIAHPSEGSLEAHAACNENGIQRLRRDLRNDDQRSRMRWILVENPPR